MRPPVPHGFAEVKRVFGDIDKYVLLDGTISPKWEEENISRVSLPQGLPYESALVARVAVHKLLYDVVKGVFQTIHQRGLWPKLHEYGGAYCYRKQRGANVRSLHSWGIAIDLNPEENQLGTLGVMDQDIISAFEAYGFEWGGNFINRKDPMHFQYATGC